MNHKNRNSHFYTQIYPMFQTVLICCIDKFNRSLIFSYLRKKFDKQKKHQTVSRLTTSKQSWSKGVDQRLAPDSLLTMARSQIADRESVSLRWRNSHVKYVTPYDRPIICIPQGQIWSSAARSSQHWSPCSDHQS